MLVVIPAVKPDQICSISVLAESLEKSFKKFSPGANHSLLVVSSPDAKANAELLLNKLSWFFTSSHLETFVANLSQGWPRENNFYFQQAAYLVPKYITGNQGWLWMELDSVPLTSNWLSIIEQEYYADTTTAHREGRPAKQFMGVAEKSLKSRSGELTDDGVHMASTGVYLGNLNTCPVLTSLPTTDQHFPYRLKWYTTVSKGHLNLNDSTLFQNNKQTANYRKEDVGIVCDSKANNAWDFHWNAVLSNKSVLLLGCLDGSLIDLVLEDRTVGIEVKPITQPPTVRKDAPKSKMFIQLPPPENPKPFPNLTSVSPTHHLINRGPAPTVVPATPVSNSIHPLHVGGRKPIQASYGDHRKMLTAEREELKQQSSVEEEEEIVFHSAPTAPPENNVPFDAPVESPIPQPEPVVKRGRNARKSAWTPERREKMRELAKERFAKKVVTV